MRAEDRGMTLLELMTAVAVVGVLTTLAVAGLRSVILNQRISGAQRAIYLETLEARQQARRSGQPVRLALTTTLQDGEPVPALRWEQLDCTDANAWGAGCPMPACLTQACGSGGCTCTHTGTPVPLPPDLDASSLVGVCWLSGETSRVVARAGTTTCDPGGAAPAAGALKLRRELEGGTFRVERVLGVNPLTGALQLVDCDAHPGEPGCA